MSQDVIKLWLAEVSMYQHHLWGLIKQISQVHPKFSMSVLRIKTVHSVNIKAAGPETTFEI